jgi:hypothetical protein
MKSRCAALYFLPQIFLPLILDFHMLIEAHVEAFPSNTGATMPVLLRQPIRRLSQAEFGELSFEVMHHVFAIHNEVGRFFDERIGLKRVTFTTLE